MNRNWEEEIDVPIGADNQFTTGAADSGQPTHFRSRRNRVIFRVPVPVGFSAKDELVWSLTTAVRDDGVPKARAASCSRRAA